MIKKISLLLSVSLTALSAHANWLGDTYADVVAFSHAKGVASDKFKGWVYWPSPGEHVPARYVQFKNNRVQAVCWLAGQDEAMRESGIWDILENEPGKWSENSDRTDGWRYFWTSDRLKTARVAVDGHAMLLATKAWVDRHFKSNSNDNEQRDDQAPAEEGDPSQGKQPPQEEHNDPNKPSI